MRWTRDRGRLGGRWQLEAKPDQLLVTTAWGQRTLTGERLAGVSVRKGWLSAAVHVPGGEPAVLKGLRKQDAPAVTSATARALARHRALPAVQMAVTWHELATDVVGRAQADGRWISQETRSRLLAAAPGEVARRALKSAAPDLADLFGRAELRAVAFLDVAFDSWLDGRNEQILHSETGRHRDFFDSVESRPLSGEQIRAVVCYDNRVQVVASAGSGKTSVMVARAAYAVRRGFVAADQILLLAFNKAAAVELQERVAEAFSAVGLDSAGVKATTFHAFGLAILGSAAGRKPRAAAWLDAGQDIEMVMRIVDELREGSSDFAYRWDLFRLLYARIGETLEGGEPDGWDSQARRQGFRTANGEVVKSEGELLIANYLYFHGIEYSYERPYSHDVADAQHSQYRPDFHYVTPTGELWHEHWGLDSSGNPRKDMTGYLESMRWKQALHAERGTTLVETTWAQVMFESGLADLRIELQTHGLKPDWNPDRPAPGSKPVKHEDLARLIRSFMSHVKSGSLTRQDLEERLLTRTPADARGRARLFLDLYFEIVVEWDAKLQADSAVDFEDMLLQAADHLDAGRVRTDWELVLVDEFQDASRARARLTRALMAGPDRYLLAVGDDWQSINRFAGADIAVMTGFADWFGPGPALRLQTTFRCPQRLCDTASAFVAKNPRQLRKTVRSAHATPGEPVRMIIASSADALTGEVKAELDHIAQVAARQRLGGPRPGARGGSPAQPVTVLVLGRYNFDRKCVPPGTWPGLDITFRTVHSSKGLEADYVIVPNLTCGTYGFPSAIQDDPVLSLAMSDPDEYPHSEERRLFYVALTRARQQVTVLTVAGHESLFVVELVKDQQVDVVRSPGPPPQLCPTCSQGTLVARSGPYGAFLGCSTFPRCRHTSKPLAPETGPAAAQSSSWSDLPPF